MANKANTRRTLVTTADIVAKMARGTSYSMMELRALVRCTDDRLRALMAELLAAGVVAKRRDGHGQVWTLTAAVAERQAVRGWRELGDLTDYDTALRAHGNLAMLSRR